MIAVVIVMSALWITAGIVVAADGAKARQSVDAILLSQSEPIVRENVRQDQYLAV